MSLLQHDSMKASILQCSAFFIVQHNVPLKGRQGSQGGVPDSPGESGLAALEDGFLITGPPGKSLC